MVTATKLKPASRKPRKLKAQSVLAVDTETTGLALFHGCRPFMVTACNAEGDTFRWTFRVDPLTRKVITKPNLIQDIKETLAGYDKLVFHNAKFDIRALSTIGVDLTNRWADIEDTLLMSHVLDSSEEHGLKPLALRYLDFSDSDEKELGDEVKKCRTAAKKLGWLIADESMPGIGKSAWKADYWLPLAMRANKQELLTTVDRYAVNDAVRTIQLYFLFLEGLENDGLDQQYRYELDLLPTLYNMESKGIPLRPGVLNREVKRFNGIRDTAEVAVVKQAAKHGLKNFNCNSPAQLKTLFYDELRFPVTVLTKNKDNPGPSTDKDALKGFWIHCGNDYDEQGNREKDSNDPNTNLLDHFFRYRLANVASSYLEAYKRLLLKERNSKGVEYVLHPTANQTGTRTTRLSSSDPNKQNISEKSEANLREVFGPREGCYWYDADYSNLEMRIFAVLADERVLIETFESGGDVHLTITLRVWKTTFKELDSYPGGYKKNPKYKRTKNFLFSLLYGASITKADHTLGLAGGYDLMRKELPGIDRLMSKTIASTKKLGYVTTLFGYRLYANKNEAYKSVNYLIQGTAGGVLKHGLINLYRNPPSSADLIATIHDQNVIEFPSTYGFYTSGRLLRSLVDAMEEPGFRIGIPTPVKVSLVKTKWSESSQVYPSLAT